MSAKGNDRDDGPNGFTPAPEVTRSALSPNPTNLTPTEGPALTVVVVDDNHFVRELMSARLNCENGRYRVVAEQGDVKGAVDACTEFLPDLVILDINLPDGCGIEAVPVIAERSPKTRVLLCTAYASDDRMLDSLRCGAHGFVEKTNTWDDFLEAVKCVSGGERYFRSHSSPALMGGVGSQSNPRSMPPVALSRREREILTLVAQGDSTKEIAGKLFISIGTVDTHRTNLMAKLKTRNVAGLVGYAYRAGLIR